MPCMSWLLRSRVRNFRRDLWITLYFIFDTLVYKFMKGVSRRAGDSGSNVPLCDILQSARFNSLMRSNFVVVQIWNYACMRSFDLLSWKMNISWKQFASAFRNDKKAVGSVSTTDHNMKLRFSLLWYNANQCVTCPTSAFIHRRLFAGNSLDVLDNCISE